MGFVPLPLPFFLGLDRHGPRVPGPGGDGEALVLSAIRVLALGHGRPTEQVGGCPRARQCARNVSCRQADGGTRVASRTMHDHSERQSTRRDRDGGRCAGGAARRPDARHSTAVPPSRGVARSSRTRAAMASAPSDRAGTEITQPTSPGAEPGTMRHLWYDGLAAIPPHKSRDSTYQARVAVTARCRLWRRLSARCVEPGCRTDPRPAIHGRVCLRLLSGIPPLPLNGRTLGLPMRGGWRPRQAAGETGGWLVPADPAPEEARGRPAGKGEAPIKRVVSARMVSAMAYLLAVGLPARFERRDGIGAPVGRVPCQAGRRHGRRAHRRDGNRALQRRSAHGRPSGHIGELGSGAIIPPRRVES